MTRTGKVVLATSAVAIVGAVALAGPSLAQRGFGAHGMMMAGPALEMLKGVDTNADGALSQDEINAAVNTRYTTFDANKDGQLSLDEFQALWADLTRPVAVRAFQFLDPNGDAAVARTEVDERFGSLVSRFDRNDDGMLSPDDRPQGGRGGHGGHGWRGWGGGDDRSADDRPAE